MANNQWKRDGLHNNKSACKMRKNNNLNRSIDQHQQYLQEFPSGKLYIGISKKTKQCH